MKTIKEMNIFLMLPFPRNTTWYRYHCINYLLKLLFQQIQINDIGIRYL